MLALGEMGDAAANVHLMKVKCKDLIKDLLKLQVTLDMTDHCKTDFRL